MDPIDRKIMHFLKTYVGFQEGEEVGIVQQRTWEHHGERNDSQLKDSGELADQMHATLRKEGQDVVTFNYTLKTSEHNVDPPEEVHKFFKLNLVNLIS